MTLEKEEHRKLFHNVTTGSYDGPEICELVGIYIQSKLQRLIDKKNLGLYCDDSLILLKNAKRGER